MQNTKIIPKNHKYIHSAHKDAHNGKQIIWNDYN